MMYRETVDCAAQKNVCMYVCMFVIQVKMN
jgi:hypothetical protein